MPGGLLFWSCPLIELFLKRVLKAALFFGVTYLLFGPQHAFAYTLNFLRGYE